jgi:hypothetical protein
VVTDEEPFESLPRAYSLALRLRALGADDALVAECLDVEPAALPTLMAVAEAKLARVRGEERPPTPPS